MWVGLIEDTWNVVSSVVMKVTLFHSSGALMGYGQLLSPVAPCCRGRQGANLSKPRSDFGGVGDQQRHLVLLWYMKKGRRYRVPWRVFILYVCWLAGVHTRAQMRAHHLAVHLCICVHLCTTGFQLEFELRKHRPSLVHRVECRPFSEPFIKP